MSPKACDGGARWKTVAGGIEPASRRHRPKGDTSERDLEHWVDIAVVVEEVKLERLLGKHAEFQRLYPE